MIGCARAQVLLEEIDSTIKNIKSLKTASPLEKSFIARFLVVYICGLYEESIECIVNERISMMGSKELEKFFEKHMHDGFRNPDISGVIRLFNRFDPKWSTKIQQLPLKNRQAFDFISTNKNLVAHGRPCTITLNDVITNYKLSKRVMTKIDKLVKFNH